MKIEVRKAKSVTLPGRGTVAFGAEVYIDGKKVGFVENSGHGGCNKYTPWQIQERLDAYAKTLPERTVSLGDSTFTHQPDADTVIEDAMTAFDCARALRRLFKNQVVFTLKDRKGIFAKKSRDPAFLKAALEKPENLREPQLDKILNLLPFEEAVAVYAANIDIAPATNKG